MKRLLDWRLLDGCLSRDRIRVLLEELERLLDQIAESEYIKAVLLLQLHCLKFLSCKGIANEAQLQVEVVRIPRPKLTATCLVVEVDDLLDCVADEEVVDWLILNDHVTVLKLYCIGGSSFRGRLALACNRSSICCPAQDCFDVGLVLRDKRRWPLAVVVEVVDKLEEVEVAAVRS